MYQNIYDLFDYTKAKAAEMGLKYGEYERAAHMLAERYEKEAQENLEIYLNYMEENDCSLPDPYEENQYSGKIALRVSKSVHKKLAQISEDEGISINSFINGAINHALGTEETNKKLEQMVAKIQENTEKNLKLQKFDLIFSQQIAQQWGNTLLEGVSINED